ncbi:MAG: hypothetical protein KJP00_14205 [Bacteroidia bacterium]|nr:hypothetical protein [Bacteroidia bacterium]
MKQINLSTLPNYILVSIIIMTAVLLYSCTKETHPVDSNSEIERSSERKKSKNKINYNVDIYPKSSSVVTVNCYGTASYSQYFTIVKCLFIDTGDPHHGVIGGEASFITVTNNQGILESLGLWIKNPGKDNPVYTTEPYSLQYVDDDGDPKTGFRVVFPEEGQWLRQHQHRKGGKIIDPQVVKVKFDYFDYIVVP